MVKVQIDQGRKCKRCLEHLVILSTRKLLIFTLCGHVPRMQKPYEESFNDQRWYNILINKDNITSVDLNTYILRPQKNNQSFLKVNQSIILKIIIWREIIYPVIPIKLVPRGNQTADMRKFLLQNIQAN